MLLLNRYIKDNKGQALVEFALMLPVLLLLVIGSIEFSLIINEYIVMAEAAREGARSAAVGNSNATIISTARAAASQIDTSQLIVAINPSDTRIRGESVTVTVGKPVQTITQFMKPFFPTGFTVHGTTTMRVE